MEKKLTPIMQAIEEGEKIAAFYLRKAFEKEKTKEYFQAKHLAVLEMVRHLQSLLPAEQQTFKEVWDAGEAYGIDFQSSGSQPDFNQFITQYNTINQINYE